MIKKNTKTMRFLKFTQDHGEIKRNNKTTKTKKETKTTMIRKNTRPLYLGRKLEP
jgi:hypothetical protein